MGAKRQFLLHELDQNEWTYLRGVTTRALAAVGGTGRETSVALAADHLVAVVGRGEDTERRLNDTTTETDHTSTNTL